MEISRSDSFGDRSFDECGDEEEKWDFDNPVKVDDGKGESKTWNRKKSWFCTFGHMRMVKTNVQVHVFFHYICLTENSTLVPKSTFGLIPVQGDRVLDDSEGVWSKNTIESIDQLNNINIDNGLHVKKTLYQRKGRESKFEHKMLKFVLRQQSPIMKKRSKSHEAQCYKAHHDIGFCSLNLSDAINDAEPAEGVMSSMLSLPITNLDRNSQVNGHIILSFSYTGLDVTLNRTRTGTDTKSNEVEQNNKNKYASMFSFSSQSSTNKKNVERVVKEISCGSLSQDEVMFGKSIIEEILGKRSYDQGKFLAGASYDSANSANSANSNGSGYISSSSNSGSSSSSSGGSGGSSGSSDSDSDESNLDEELAGNWQTPMSMSVESYNVQDFLKMGKVGLSQSMDELGRGYEYMNLEKEKEKAKEKDVVEVRKGMIVVSMDEQKREEKEKEKELASEKASQFIPSHLASSSSSSGSGSGSAAPSSASRDSMGSFFGNVNDVAITVGGGLGSSMLNYLGFYDGSSEIDNEPVST